MVIYKWNWNLKHFHSSSLHGLKENEPRHFDRVESLTKFLKPHHHFCKGFDHYLRHEPKFQACEALTKSAGNSHSHTIFNMFNYMDMSKAGTLQARVEVWNVQTRLLHHFFLKLPAKPVSKILLMSHLIWFCTCEAGLCKFADVRT